MTKVSKELELCIAGVKWKINKQQKCADFSTLWSSLVVSDVLVLQEHWAKTVISII